MKKDINYYRLRISTTFISWLLCAVTTINVGIFGVPKLAKETKYNTTTTTYTNSVDNKIETLPEYTSEINDGKKVTLIEYSPYSRIAENVYQRNVIEYDLSELNIDNISKYFDLKLEELDIPFKTEIQLPTASELKADDFYTDEQRKLIIQTQDLNDSIEETFGMGVFMIEFIYIMIMFFIWVSALEYSYRSHSEFSLFELLNRTKELLTMKVDYKKKREELDKIKEKLLKLLEKDEQLKIGFNNAYDIVVSKYGTNNELEDLYNQVNNIEISETIELPEDYFNPKKKVKIPISRREG